MRAPGHLSISKSGEIRLNLQFDHMSAGWNNVIHAATSPGEYMVPRVHGIGARQGWITLDECLISSLRHPSARLTELTMLPHLGFTGCHYDADEDVTFTKFDFSTESLDEWLGVSGIDVRFDRQRIRSLVEVRVPEDISIDLPDGTELKFKFGMTFPTHTKTITDIRVSQQAYLSLVSHEPRPLKYFIKLATKLRNFLRLAIGQPISLAGTTGYSPDLTRSDGNGRNFEVPIRVHYGEVGISEKEQKVPWFRMLFLYRDVEYQIEKLIANWLQSFEIFGPALDVYFTAMANTSQYPEVEFLQRVQGIEIIHRRSSSETEMSCKEFASTVDSLLLNCPNRSREWLRMRLKYANELSLRKRLRLMIEPFAQLFGDTKQQKSFINQVVNTRNYLTHYDLNLESHAAQGRDLWRLTKRLEALFQLHTLKFIGMDIMASEQGIEGHSNLGRLLKLADLDVPVAPGTEHGTH